MKTNGFMLIEIIVYIGLFSIMIGGLLVSVFFISKSSYENELIFQEEMNFVIQKLNWALSGVEIINVSPDNSYLHIINPNISPDEIIFKFNQEYQRMELKINGNDYFPITTQNVKVENTQDKPTKFVFISSLGDAPMGVSIFLNIANFSINYNKYLQYEN
jgi:hypothetical protein